MRHSPLLRALLVVPVALVAVAACGDDSSEPGEASVPADETLPTVAPAGEPATNHEYATGPDDVVISVEYEGGFVPMDAVFTRTPQSLVTGDGRALSTGPVIAIYPGPLLPNVLQQSITPEGIQSLLAEADELGLLADVTYERNDMIADAPDTVVTINVDGATYRHQAYALDIDEETDPARANLSAFVAAMGDLAGSVGVAELGPEEPFRPANDLMRATPTDPATLDVDVEPTIVAWPDDAPVRLADAADCASVPADAVASLFADATVLTFFTDADVTYSVAAVPQIPGRTC
ncbi:MAG: hypothetical protein ABW328_17405 [Ilumatobacteraceae bacterium]